MLAGSISMENLMMMMTMHRIQKYIPMLD